MPPYCVLFPSSSNGVREPAPCYEREQLALESLNIPWRVAHIDALQNGEIAKVLKYTGDIPPVPILYRGWILHPEEYSRLEETIIGRGGQLITSSEAYQNALLFPRFFPAIAAHSFPATWIVGTSPNEAVKAARQLGPPPYFIKDHAKSAKEIWPKGCLVRSRRSMAAAIRALKGFRGDRFEGGIVIRPLLRLRLLGENPFGGEIHEEYRLFFLHGKLVSRSAYDRLEGPIDDLPDHSFLPQKIHSPFFSADIVVTEDGRHLVLEIGDGGTSGLPPTVSAFDFHSAILRIMTDTGEQAISSPAQPA